MQLSTQHRATFCHISTRRVISDTAGAVLLHFRRPPTLRPTFVSAARALHGACDPNVSTVDLHSS
jgi:hypothetical protein